MNKKTLVIGASTNPSRYSYLAVNALRKNGHDVVAIGLREGKVSDVEISNEKIHFHDIDTITLYVGPGNQAVYSDYIMNINPRRVIFNPGTENPELEKKLIDTGIFVEEACTLVLLSTGQY
ncbi:MAG: CoA-binding protein [Prolixibacteraceae bacterium]|nr:CoA-binding protein [Prolixibacteraceae bacterium]